MGHSFAVIQNSLSLEASTLKYHQKVQVKSQIDKRKREKKLRIEKVV